MIVVVFCHNIGASVFDSDFKMTLTYQSDVKQQLGGTVDGGRKC
jgi:hypothetical protein